MTVLEALEQIQTFPPSADAQSPGETMTLVTALDRYEPAQGDLAVFLAGSISGSWDWQTEMVRLLQVSRLVLLNPRRPDFPMDDPAAGREQIQWEHEHLRMADAVLFWFSHETLAPITLFELGYWLGRPVPLFIGCDPGYARKLDVVEQIRLERPGLDVVDNLKDLAAQVRRWEAEIRPKNPKRPHRKS